MTVRRRAALAIAAAGTIASVATACSDDPGEPPAALTTPSVDDAAVEVPVLGVEVVHSVPHRTSAWTEGLVWDDGVLYESSGGEGTSNLAELDPATGDATRVVDVDPELYAEGLAQVGEELVQITWKDGVAIRWDAATFEPTGEHEYSGEGWGLCFDGEQLVMSDGSPTLTFRDPETFEETGDVEVTLDGEAVEELNELECVDHPERGRRVYANVWHTGSILEIDPGTGEVTAVIDGAPLHEEVGATVGAENAFNGIAYDPEADTFWLTGKLWRTLFEVRLTER